MDIKLKQDPITRYISISYDVPENAFQEIEVYFSILEEDSREWVPASVLPYISETAMKLIPDDEWESGMNKGIIYETACAGFVRCAVFNPFYRFNGNVKGKLKVEVYNKQLEIESTTKLKLEPSVIDSAITEIDINNNDVIVMNDWTNVIQKDAISTEPKAGEEKWWVKKVNTGSCEKFTLEVLEKGVELPQLTYPLNLKGHYAIFVSLPPKLGTIELRFSGEERTQVFEASRPGEEILWQWRDLEFQHLVIKQTYRSVHEYEDDYKSHLDTVRLVPITKEQVNILNSKWEPLGEEKIVAGYNEPYSWAFYENVSTNLQHWEPLIAFSEAKLDIIDIQMGRGGCNMSNESRKASQLLYETHGDPVRGKVPKTSNVGKMQQYTNMLGTQLKYATALGMKGFANLGATNCYIGTGLESDFSKQHPQWRDGSCLKYEIPEVRAHILSLIEEALIIGARGVSVDWCRYPNALKSKEPVTIFFRELRSLTKKYENIKKYKIAILTRFPAKGVYQWEHMDYKTWVKEGLVDYLCPGNLQGRHMNFPIKEYVETVKRTDVKLLPACDGLEWGLKFPGMMFERTIKCYEEGAHGIYIYQCDAPVLSHAQNRRYISIMKYPDALYKWKEEENKKQKKYSKGIYITKPHQEGKYTPWSRLRVWCEGFIPGKLEMYIDNKLINQYQYPPYVLTSEERKDDNSIEPGTHILKIRAFDGQNWIEKYFEIEY